MVTTWPKDFPGLGTSASRLAAKINKASQGRINIKVFGSGELVPAYEFFDAVRNGVADMCHDSPYYWLSKHPATVFFSTLPSGLSSLEQTLMDLMEEGKSYGMTYMIDLIYWHFLQVMQDFRCLDGSKKKLIH